MKNFFSKEETIFFKDYFYKGFCIFNVRNMDSLNFLKNNIKKLILKEDKNLKKEKNDPFNNLHKFIKKKNINNFRLKIFKNLNNIKNIRFHYFKVSSPFIEMISGNELVMQKNLNLSIQMPKDDESILDIHADTWSGDSAYETVAWIPLVDCRDTKSMFILPANKYENFLKITEGKKIKNSKKLFNLLKKDFEWIKIKFGQVLLFNQTLPHGNVLNKTDETRFSMNCRFKSIFSPYGDKKIGEFFEPITLRPASKIGMKYKLPKF